MKKILFLSVVLSACSTVPTPTNLKVSITPQQVQTATQLAQLTLQTAAQLSNGKITPQTEQEGMAALSGVGALAQAYVGSGLTPSQANISTGAGNPIIGQTVQTALPNTPITQNTVNGIYQAAAQVQNP